MPIQIDIVPLVVGLVSALGGGIGIGKLIDGLVKIRAGMSARESGRALDIVKQRDAALAREAKAWRLVDAEAEKRRQVQEYAARLRRQIIALNGEPDPEPVIERTLTRKQLEELREEEKEP